MRESYATRRQKDVSVMYKLIISCKLADSQTSPHDIDNKVMKLFKRNWIALVIFSTDFCPFDDSTSFYADQVFRHSPRTTTVGYLCLPERRIDTRTTGCARLIRESKLSCIIHYSLFLSFSFSLSLSLSQLPSFPVFWIGNFWNSLCRFWRGNLSRLWHSHYGEKSAAFSATNVQIRKTLHRGQLNISDILT